ncbi:hypothetical protein JOB18_025395 [Solea senegalensis]|uniref:Uncharacterized protein n=1 Tax=Solea senegalensis TaxID=28829 RepID=A0AAV6SZL6_SOLSE|nr:hypothetical protein JOB18_025395 [Solea senegalensis]
MDPSDNVETGETENYPELFYVPIPGEAPFKREQEKLSGVVKNVHRKLRRKYREGKLLQRALPSFLPTCLPACVCGPAAEWLALTNTITVSVTVVSLNSSLCSQLTFGLVLRVESGCCRQ